MKKIIWVIGEDRKQMIDMQRQINSSGSMRARCLLSYQALQRAVTFDSETPESEMNNPSLIIIDYSLIVTSDFEPLSFLKEQRNLAGVPLFFVVEKRSEELDEECYAKGAMVILHKSFSKSDIMRIENAAWQYENTKNYEKMLQKQALDLKATKEIMRLNQQLKARNDLLHQIFGRYFSDEVVEVILDQPQGAAIGGEKREVTVMMSDIRGFTSFSEDMEPESVTTLLDFYFGKMLEAILKYHGTVIEFLGDGVLSVFGAPFHSDNHTSDAIAAAISMQNAMEDVNDYCKEHGYSTLEMGIGIHCGEAFVGNVGSEKMMRYNVIGRVVNECSRIESNSVGGQVLVSEEAISKAGCPVTVAGRMNVVAKGLKNPITVSEVIGIEGSYGCHIEKDETYILREVEEEISFHLYPLDGKQIKNMYAVSRLKQCSDKWAVVEAKDLSNMFEDFMDVRVVAFDGDGKELFHNVYAKIVEMNDLDMVLRFTHVNSVFSNFVADI